jgi:hypothetical protein
VKTYAAATVAGVAVAAVYVLSPLTVVFALAMWALHRYAISGLDADERRWLTALLVVAVITRVAAIAWLFAHTNHAQTPFGVFFGDEEFYVRRSIWLRNVALNIPIHSADLIYAFDDSGWTGHLYVLAFLEVLFGPSPYGVHLSGVALYAFAAVMLFRLVRASFGRAPAFLTLTLLCFLPSLFMWSITVLKEPLYFFLTVSSLTLAVAIVRARRWPGRIAAAAGLVALVLMVGTVRNGGAVLLGSGIALGWAAAWLVRKPKVLVAIVVAVPILTGATLRDPKRQIRVYNTVQAAARQHWGYVQTPGWTYKLLDEHYYQDISWIGSLEFQDGAQFLVRAVERYITAPWPWEVESTAALAYIPEQIVWYLIVVMLPVGILFSLRRDPVLTALLVGIAVTAALATAFLSGNVGTLVRLRVLASPYFTAVTAVGVCELLARAARRSDGPVLQKAVPLWQ